MKSCFVAKISKNTLLLSGFPRKQEELLQNCEWKFPTATCEFSHRTSVGAPGAQFKRTRLEDRSSVELTDEALTPSPGEAFPIENIDYKMADSSDLLV